MSVAVGRKWLSQLRKRAENGWLSCGQLNPILVSEAEGIYTCYNNQNLNKAAAPLEKHTAYVCSLSGLQSRHGLHRQLLQHAATEASMCTAAYAQLVDEASTGERRASTGCVLCRGIHWRWRWWERQQQRMCMVHQARTPHLNHVQAGVCTPSPKRS